MAELRVLNFNQNAEISCETLAENGENISKHLQKLMLQIKGQFMCDDGKSIDYNGIRTSDIFSKYVEESTRLVHLDLTTLTDQQKMAFFINIYNALTIHGICEQGVPSSVLGVKNFWKSIAYNIGSHGFTLDDIEHGILRGNRPHPSSPNPLFNDNDPRLQHSVKSVDPRIHFALVCGAKSCPAINVYSTTNLERGLEAATENFCSQEVQVDLNAKQVTLSKIFLWYKSDFAENDIDLLRWIQAHVSGKLSLDLQQLIKDHDDGGITIKIAHSDYNWNLNNIAPAKI